MKHTHLFITGALVFWSAVIDGLAQGAVPPLHSYAVHDLGTLGGTRSEAYHINNDGQITGYSYAGGPETYGFLWQNGVMRKLGALPGGQNSTAYATGGGASVGFAEGRVTNYTYWTNINTGETGTNTIVSNYFKACRWIGGAIQPLDGLAPGGGGVAQAVNLLGDRIAGYSGWSFPSQINSNDVYVVDRAVLWSSGSPEDLGPGPWSRSRAYGLNTLGDVVGTALFDVHSNHTTHAVMFGSPHRDLHSLTNHVNSVALAINDHRQVVGYSFNVSTHVFDEPFFWSETTGMKRLTTPSGDPYGQAMGINNDGTAVGFVGSTAAMWVNAGQTNESLVLLQDLLRPGDPFALRVATSINFWGEITGYGLSRAFLLYPTNTRHRIDGTIQYIAGGTDGLVVTNALAEASVELLAVRGSEIVARASGFADSAGRFSFLMPAYVDQSYAVKFTLTDGDSRIAVYDHGMDTNNVAWLRTPPFSVTGDTRIDVVMTINANTNDAPQNETAYQLNGAAFSPVLAPSGTDGAPGSASNSGADRFAHAAAIYRNTRLAARFAVDVLGLDMPLIPVRAFVPETWGAWGPVETNRVGVLFQRAKCEPTAYFTPAPPTLVFGDILSAYNKPFVGISATNRFGALERYRRVSNGAIANGAAGGRNRPDNREFHEYGHYITYVSSIAGAGRLPDLFWEEDLNGNGFLDPEEDVNGNGLVDQDQNHFGLLNSNSSDAWTEGWAEFISAVISGTMLDQREKPNPASYWVGGTPVNFDDDQSVTNLITARRFKAEEWVVSTLLWDLYDGPTAEGETLQLPLDLYWQTLTTSGPALGTFHDVLNTLLDYSFNHPFVLAPTGLVQRILTAGLFDDASVPGTAGNGQYDAGEILGATSWIASFPHRDGAELPERSYLQLTATDTGGAVLEDVFFDIAIEYEPPLEERNTRYPFFAPGPGPHGVPILLPPHPSRARIKARKPGYAGGGELVVTSEDFWAAPAGVDPGTVDLFFLEHTFTLTVGGADLVLTLSPTSAAVPMGGVFSLGISVTNLGPNNATLVTLTNTLPGDVTLLSALPSQGACVLTNGAVVCDLGALVAGEGARVVLDLMPAHRGTFAFTANVSANEADPAPENNQQTSMLAVIGAPAMSMSVAPYGGPITLAWQGEGGSWKLEYATSLTAPILWQPVPFGTYEAPDGTTYATFPRPPFNAFFRLHSP